MTTNHTTELKPNVVATAPERIYLVIGEGCPPDEEFDELEEVTWCQDKIDDNSIEYLRTDLIPRLRAEIAELMAEREAMAKQEPRAWIEHHKAGDNLNWEEVNHPYAKATPLFASPVPIPEGWQLVPKELTDRMKREAHYVVGEAGSYRNGILPEMYRAMLAAAPAHPSDDAAGQVD